MFFKNSVFFLIILFLNVELSYSNHTPSNYKTVYYYTQLTSQKNGNIVLSFVKSVSCDWGYRNRLGIERVIKAHFSNWASFKPWSKEYRGNVYVFESKKDAQYYRNRIRSSSGVYDDNDRYYDSYSYDCDYHFFLDADRAEERKRKAKEDEQRKIKAEQDRKAAEQLRIQKEKEAEAEKIRFTNWSNTTKKTMLSKLAEWDSNVQKYINQIHSRHQIFSGEQLPSYLDIYALLLEKTLISQTIPIEEKSDILQRVLWDTYNYYKIYYDYNYKKEVPSEILKKLNAIYIYGKAHFGFHPATNNYNILSGLNVTPYKYKSLSKKIEAFETRGISYFNKGKPSMALFEYFSALANNNSSIGVLYAREGANKELQWRVNLGYLLYYNGYFRDAYDILKRERTTIDVYNKNSKNTNYWEIYSFEIASLYYFSFDMAIKEAIKFEDALLKQYSKSDLNDLDNIKITRNKNSLATNDISVQNAYSRTLVYWSKSLLEKGKKKESHKILKPIVKLLKKNTPLSFFGNNDNQLSVLLKIHEPKLYEKYNLGKPSPNFKHINQTYDHLSAIETRKSWEEIHAEKISSFYSAYSNKDFDLAISIAKELLPTLRYDLVRGNKAYKNIMTKAALASTANQNYESAICFSHYALLNKTKKEEDVAYLLLLTNIILSNKYYYTIDKENIYVKPKDNTVKYNFEALLTIAAAKNYDGDYGYEILEYILNDLAKKGEKSIYLPHIYNAVKKSKNAQSKISLN